MTTTGDRTQPAVTRPTPQASPYDQWITSTGIPIHRGYFIEDLRTIELAPWPERGCDAAFLVLAGQEGVTEARVTEIAPAVTLPPQKFALDEVVYVVQGRGLTTVWSEGNGTKKTFEWQKSSMFMLPRNYTHQLSNAQGSEPVRLLHYNYLPLSMAIVPDPDFFFNNPYVDRSTLQRPELARTDAPGGFLHLMHGALEISSSVDNASVCTALNHLVRVAERRCNWLVCGHALDASLSAGNHGVLHILRRRRHRRDIRDNIS